MKNVVEDEIVKELSIRLAKKEKVVRIMLKKALEFGYNFKKAKELIIEFILKNKS